MLVGLDNSSVAWYGSRLRDSLDGYYMQYGTAPVEVGGPQPVSTDNLRPFNVSARSMSCVCYPRLFLPLTTVPGGDAPHRG
jgi:hypothetical protein